MKLTTVLIFGAMALTSGQALAGRKSVNIWKGRFPRANCSRNECAKNVPAAALDAALDKITYVRPKMLKKKYMFVADFTQHSKNKRGYLINIKTGKSVAYHVAHGKNSGNGRGNTVRFSNTNQSKMSSKGLYLAAETYSGKHGFSMRMDGLEHTNSRARRRAIVLHGADYMSPSYIKRNGRSGRSWGCPAVARNLTKSLINKIKGGSAYYIHGN